MEGRSGPGAAFRRLTGLLRLGLATVTSKLADLRGGFWRREAARVAGLEVLDLRKSYGDAAAVSGISFTVRPGEIVGLLRPNGAGKTTLHALAGLARPSGGTARVALL